MHVLSWRSRESVLNGSINLNHHRYSLSVVVFQAIFGLRLHRSIVLLVRHSLKCDDNYPFVRLGLIGTGENQVSFIPSRLNIIMTKALVYYYINYPLLLHLPSLSWSSYIILCRISRILYDVIICSFYYNFSPYNQYSVPDDKNNLSLN